ncbi:MAG: hypothetical protein GEV12_20830 [Micromonosporaceae bacterium]|nr:hypothetical protein [Micromonosporaceae bacterium]
MADRAVPLRLAGRTVAEYVVWPEVDPALAPRPFLHPVRTFGGGLVTDALPADHRWHLGASLAVPDVSGTNLWGGRSYLRDTGYGWRQDHGRIVHTGFLVRADDHIAHRLCWQDPAGATLLEEQRHLRARPLPQWLDGWQLELAYTVTAPPDREVTLGSPATNGRPGGAGYGGFFWRAAPAPTPPEVFTATATGEAAVNGSTEPWLALASTAPHPYTLVFLGLAAGDHWFVRAEGYPGVCAALAFTEPRVIGAGTRLARRHRVLVVDGVLPAPVVGRLVAARPG